jgi:hypothetical protein
MTRKGVFPAFLASALGLMVALPGVGRADGPYHNGPYYDGPGHDGHYHDGPYPGRAPYHGPYPARPAYRGSYYPPHYSQYYPHYYPPHYPGYPAYPAAACTNCNKQHKHNNHNGNNNELWYGLLGGGALGYVLGNVLPVPHLNQDYVPPPEDTGVPTGP